MLLSVQSPLQYCASQPLDQIKVTALSAHQTRIENLSLLLTRDGGDVSFRYVCCRLPWSWVHAELDHRFFYPWRADGIDAEASRHLKLTERRRVCLKVQSQKTCNYDNYDHDADDVENVHCVLRLTYARLGWLPPRARCSALSKLASRLSIASSCQASESHEEAIERRSLRW
jgi:hypothetical protein